VAYDRLGIDEQTVRILDTEVPSLTVPVRPGRNLAVIVEVAAMNYRLRRIGYNAARVFSDELAQAIEEHEE
jgi:HPr kinase/phosphorylase